MGRSECSNQRKKENIQEWSGETIMAQFLQPKMGSEKKRKDCLLIRETLNQKGAKMCAVVGSFIALVVGKWESSQGVGSKFSQWNMRSSAEKENERSMGVLKRKRKVWNSYVRALGNESVFYHLKLMLVHFDLRKQQFHMVWSHACEIGHIFIYLFYFNSIFVTLEFMFWNHWKYK